MKIATPTLLTLALLALVIVAGVSRAQNFPSRPLQLVIPFAATGSTTQVLRAISPGMSERLGQQVVIINRPGGAATIGMNIVAKATPDGHTLGAATLSFAANPPFMAGQMPFDTEKDFLPVSLVSRLPMALTVNLGVPVRSLKELIALAKARPGELNYGSAGIASSGHLGIALFEMMAGIRMTHIPYGSTSSLVGVIGGQTQVQIGPIPTVMSIIQSGKAIALGVSSLKPVPLLPGVPTISESGVPGFEAYEWVGIVVPKATPRPVITRLNKEIVASVADAEATRRIEAIGGQVIGSTPEAFGQFIRKELATWAKVGAAIHASGGAQ